MLVVTKEFHFYAAHRNEEVGGKCASIHGHRYGLTISVAEPRNGSVTILFEDLERRLKPLLDEVDHCLFLNENDPAAKALMESGACENIYMIGGPTSVENLAESFLRSARLLGLNVVSLTLRETDTSSVTVTP